MDLPFRRMLRRPRLAAAALALSFAAGLTASLAQEEGGISAFASAEDPPAFDDPVAAIDALRAVLAADDLNGLAELLGLDAAKLAADQGTMESYARIRDSAAEQIVVEDTGDRMVVDLGAGLWPLPFPLVKGEDGRWAFDTYAGLEEIVNRRVGENELEAVATMRAYVDAQEDYAAEDRDGDGVLEYAQKLISSDGQTDGLYWPAELGAGESPAGAFVEQAAVDAAVGGDGYFGYRFRILTGQGDRIAGGAYDYVINGNMIAGFALLAWPVRYGETGVYTFAVSHHGIVYETDLGPATEAIAGYIDRFNPDDSWSVVAD